MYKAFIVVAAAGVGIHGIAWAQSSAPQFAPTRGPGIVCKFVVSDEPGAKPYELCLSKAEWAAKELADSKDATRTVCKYQEMPGTRFRSAKVCMPASEWAEQQRLERQAIDQIQRSVCVSGAGC